MPPSTLIVASDRDNLEKYARFGLLLSKHSSTTSSLLKLDRVLHPLVTSSDYLNQNYDYINLSDISTKSIKDSTYENVFLVPSSLFCNTGEDVSHILEKLHDSLKANGTLNVLLPLTHTNVSFDCLCHTVSRSSY
ncbi:Anamorsin -like protein [Babesia sp. Xinjiang]|uniref:Anamorsin -like protein n=1 Tax=Babesia sp. Xinjiang TaxID=462227 RepID=UPI000A249319|nr:Anamorsin -like protein [Babesia sp. Xinjiang]ORM42271.1 Anamorsin -like protein [Babesia sp. Xinjiang]